MKYQLHVATAVIATCFIGLAVILVAAGWVEQPGPQSLALVMAGLTSFVVGSAFGAVSVCTYMTPYERDEYRQARAEKREHS